ncbi:MAG: hypothetical protein FH748_09965 [Balneolaceae bacterium]|nr:hypothetical protein [Balneolaceae bacterium]
MKSTCFPTFILILAAALYSCGPTPAKENISINPQLIQDSTKIAFSIENGLQGPEAVRFDPKHDVYFISNFNGGGNTLDANGFITKADSNGRIIELKFIQEDGEYPLHAPRGMFITETELWVADVIGVHSFDLKSGKQNSFVSFKDFEVGFLNDVSADEQGNIYITDTGTSRVYIIQNGAPSVYLDALPIAPNGISRDINQNRFVLAPWGGDSLFYSFGPEKNLQEYASMDGGYFDGIEFMDDYMLTSSQQDSSIRIYDGKDNHILIHTPGRGADIGIDTARRRIAVPYIALNRVDIWELSN